MARFAAVACLAVSAKGMCVDADKPGANEPDCVNHVKWAMGQGFGEHPEWYTPIGIHAGSPFADFQCSLWNMKGAGKHNGESHGCKRPCSSTLDECKAPALAPNFKQGANVTAAVVEEGSSSISTSAIVLIVLLICAILVAVAYVLIPKEKKKGPQKKKRALAPPPAPEIPAAPVADPPQVMYSMVQPTYTPIPTTVTTAQPVYYQQPMAEAVTYAAPQGPSFVYAAPHQQAQSVYMQDQPMYMQDQQMGSMYMPDAGYAQPAGVAYYQPQ